MTGRPTHRMSRTAIYGVWCHMWGRCYNENDAGFERYGGRGIGIDPHWAWFENFYNDMGDQPYVGATIERIDNDADYGPANCEWANKTKQARNTRKSEIWIVEGVEYPSLTAAADAFGVCWATIRLWCKGRTRGIYSYQPRPNCSTKKVYA